jgi:hypothetical protein
MLKALGISEFEVNELLKELEKKINEDVIENIQKNNQS